jgi:hypothetical protein
MIRPFALLLLLLLPLAMTGCSNGNIEAPPANKAHPPEWIKTHPADALAIAGFANCVKCHEPDLQGYGAAVSCYSCHYFNTAPPFTTHPDAWADPYNQHRGYADDHGFTACATCHGVNLRGSPAAPSCFSTSFDGRGCHADGPGHAPHPVDGTYLEGSLHGPDAKADLTACQECHGNPGGPGSNPLFNRGIFSMGGTGCEACHGANYAHPADWAGPSNTFHYTAGNIGNACTLCHGVNLDGVDGVGVSCLGCHSETTAFTLDCTFCHQYPPAGTPDVATATGVAHGNVANVSLHETCVICHGMRESDTGGSFAVATDYLLFDPATDTPGSHWNGQIDMSSSPGYNETDFGCDAALCHANDVDHRLSNSGLPVALHDFGFDSAVPHPVDGSFLDPANHGPAAKGLTAAFPSGMANCRICHAEAGANPRFNVGINDPDGTGGNGCESCHNDRTAHPSADGRDNVHWYDGTYRHADSNGFTTSCTLCHGTNLGGIADGGVGPACTACHSVDPVVNASGCVSCHNLPPDGGVPAGNPRPNRQGQHFRAGHNVLISANPLETCGRCHNGAGVGTAAHFDTTSPAEVNFIHPNAADTISVVSTDTDTTCNGACHIETGTYTFTFNHDNRKWYE